VRPELGGKFGAAASTHWLGTGVAMAVLERGGNAFDAAVAAGLTLQVVEPDECGPGGEMSAILYSAGRDEVAVVCGQGPAPAEATIGRLRGLGLDMVPGNGLLAACVPGAVGGWLLLLLDYGTWRLRDVLDFAIVIHDHPDRRWRLVAEVDACFGETSCVVEDFVHNVRCLFYDGVQEAHFCDPPRRWGPLVALFATCYSM